MNEVELAQKMIMNYFQGTLKDDFTQEQKEILETVFQKVKIEYGTMRKEIEGDAGEYNREEEKILAKQKYERQKIEKEKAQNYQYEDLFKKNRVETQQAEINSKIENVAMVEYKESVFTKILNKIKSIFKRN